MTRAKQVFRATGSTIRTRFLRGTNVMYAPPPAAPWNAALPSSLCEANVAVCFVYTGGFEPGQMMTGQSWHAGISQHIQPCRCSRALSLSPATLPLNPACARSLSHTIFFFLSLSAGRCAFSRALALLLTLSLSVPRPPLPLSSSLCAGADVRILHIHCHILRRPSLHDLRRGRRQPVRRPSMD